MVDINAEELRNQIDTSKNEKIELQEMEEFLKSDENIKKLGDAMESGISTELLEEFKTVIGELCDKIMKSESKKTVSLNQFSILSFYFKRFDVDGGNEKTYNKVRKILGSLYAKYLKQYKKYSAGKGEKPTGVVAEYFENLQLEKLNQLKEIARERMKDWEAENDPLRQRQKKEQERLDKLLDRWETDKKEIEDILHSELIITDEDIKKLLYFRDFYYKEGHISYKKDDVNQDIYNSLTEELGEGLMAGIVGYDKIAREIDEKISVTNDIRHIMEQLNKSVMGSYEDPLKNLEYLGVSRMLKPNWANLQRDIKTVKDVDKINENTVGNYINLKGVSKENYVYVANNLKVIIKRHLQVNPGYTSIFGGRATDMKLGTIEGNNKFTVDIYNSVQSLIEKPEKTQINTIVSKIRSGTLGDLEFIGVWMGAYLGGKYEKNARKQDEIIKSIFDKISPTDSDVFFRACDIKNSNAPAWKNPLKDFKNDYMVYWLIKDNAVTCLGDADKNGGENSVYLLDFSKKVRFENFGGKGLKSGELDFDKVYQYTQDFYNGLKNIAIDESIPLNDIVSFLSFRSKKQEENKKLDQKAREISNSTMNAAANAFVPVQAQLKQVRNASDPYDEKIKNNCISIEEKYAALLLKSKNRPRKKIQGISGSNLTLDFKWNNPKDIVRDNFGEKLSDSWNEFVYNIKHDWKAAAGSIVGMVAGIAAAGASCVSGNVFLAAGAFTVASRLGNGVTQEVLNAMQYLAEEHGVVIAPGFPVPIYLPSGVRPDKATGGNAVKDPGVSFLLGVGAYEPARDNKGELVKDNKGNIKYEFIGWERFGSNLGFDYLSGVAMFGAFKALGPVFSDIKGLKIPKNVPVIGGLPTGVPLEFASKWLLVQNFGIDMPMNALHTGTDVFFNIGEPHQRHHHRNPIYGQVEGEYPEESEYYESGNIGDAFEAMLGNMEEHISLNNQSQVLFNTLLYCGMLEAGQGFASKMKSYMPVARIEKYEASNRKFQEAQRDFVSEISKKGLKINEKFELVNAKSGEKIGKLEFLKFKGQLLRLKGMLAEHTKATQELIESERILSNDGSKTYHLFKKLHLFSDKQPPMRVLKDKIIKAKKQYQKAIESGDLKGAQELKEVILEHQSAQMVLVSEFHPDAINNIRLSNEERVQKAEELLQSELTPEQKQAILDAHNAPGDAYSLSIPELMAKSKILLKAGFTEAQVRILIENCICGKMKGTGEIKSERIGEGPREEIGSEPQSERLTYAERMGSELHEEWRRGRLKEDGTYEPRIKKTTDAERIEKHGTDEVDIANTKFEELPNDWKAENLEAAKVAVDLVYERIKKGETITPEMIEEMSSKVHEEWLKRNTWAKGGELDKPYSELPEVEKAKDRNQVLQAIKTVKGEGIEQNLEQQKLESKAYIEQIKNNFKVSGLDITLSEFKKMSPEQQTETIKKIEKTIKFKDGITDQQKIKFVEKIGEILEQLKTDILKGKVDDIDFDPINGTFRVYDGGLEGFIKEIALTGKMDQNFLNNIKLTIEYLTKRIINIGGGEKVTLKEWEERLDIGEDLIKDMEKHMINQWLDNPQYFNSHGFDHTILVHSLIVKVRNGLKEASDTIGKKYGLESEKSEKLYNALIELSAILHDFGYPRQDGGDKTTHATGGAELFYKELKPKFEDFIIKEIGLDAEVAGDLACDMYNSICFHGADKVETHYVSRVEGLDNEGHLYGGILVPKPKPGSKSGIITSENMKIYADFQSYRISYKSEGFREGMAGRYTGLIDGKLVEFESTNGTKREIVKEEEKGKLVKLDGKDGKSSREVSIDAVRTAVKDWQEISKTTAYSQAIELSVNWGTNIKVFTSQGEGKNGIEFKKVVDEKNGKIIGFERKIGDKVENLQDFLKENDLLRIEGEGERGKKPQIEINVENQRSLNEQSLNQALGWLADFTIKTDKGRITYEKNSGKYYDGAGNEIAKGDLLNGYKIIEIEANVRGGKTIKVNDNAYEGRFLNEGGERGGAGLEYRSWDIKEDPLMSMIRIADNLDMAFNRLIPSQRNAIFLTTLYNLENGGKLAELFQKMEKFNQWKKGKLKLKEGEQPPTEPEIRKLFENELDIDIYKIFEEEGHETNDGWSSNGQKQLKKKFSFDRYYKDGKFDLVTFKQDLFDEIKESGAIQSHVGKDILDMSHDLMAEGMIGSYSVRHMVGLRPIKNVDFKEGTVQIEIDMDIYFNSHISDKIVDEKGKDIYLVEYHIWREGTALDAEPNGGARIDSHIVDSEGNIIGNINSKGEVDYSPMFKDGVIKPEYEKYENSPLLNKSKGGKKKFQPQNK